MKYVSYYRGFSWSYQGFTYRKNGLYNNEIKELENEEQKLKVRIKLLKFRRIIFFLSKRLKDEIRELEDRMRYANERIEKQRLISRKEVKEIMSTLPYNVVPLEEDYDNFIEIITLEDAERLRNHLSWQA